MAEVSKADAPLVSVPFHGALRAASKTPVTVDVAAFVTLNGSQALVPGK
jgi:hypothetical protein